MCLINSQNMQIFAPKYPAVQQWANLCAHHLAVDQAVENAMSLTNSTTFYHLKANHHVH